MTVVTLCLMGKQFTVTADEQFRLTLLAARSACVALKEKADCSTERVTEVLRQVIDGLLGAGTCDKLFSGRGGGVKELGDCIREICRAYREEVRKEETDGKDAESDA